MMANIMICKLEMTDVKGDAVNDFMVTCKAERYVKGAKWHKWTYDI